MDRGMAHRASLIFLRKIVRRPHRTPGRQRVALQAEHAGLAHSQQARIGPSMSRVTTRASLGFHRQVLKHKGALLVGMALGADRVATGHIPHLTKRAGAVQVVTIRALHKTFIYTMVKWLGKVRFGRGMTPITELRLGLRQQALGLFSMMRRVTVYTAHVVAGMSGSREVGLPWVVPVAAEATRVRLWTREFLEDNNLRLVATSVHVRRSRTMTRLAPMATL